MLKLLILDRDGVINYDSDAYIKSVEEWIPLPGSIEAIAQLSKAGWTVAIATNQSGIARGYYDIATLEAMHARLRALVAEQGGEVGLVVYCPHGPDEGCDCQAQAWHVENYCRTLQGALGWDMVRRGQPR